MLLGTLLLGALGWLAGWVFWPLAIPFAVVWIWMIAFFRDPRRVRTYEPGMICAPADGTVMELVELPAGDDQGGRCAPFAEPTVRIGIFLSLFDVHVNRAPCAGTVIDAVYRPGEFLDARHPQCGERNESAALVLDPGPSMPGPVVVRQVAGKVARRIICNIGKGDRMAIGYRYGLIKFGSRTELIIPRRPGTEIMVKMGDVVRGGLTIVARQPVVTQDRLANDA